MTVEPREFHLEEYKLLKQQISSLIERVSTIIQYVLGGIAVFYTWLITNANIHDLMNSGAMWIPVLLSFFGVLMVITITVRITVIRKYIRILEDYFNDTNRS